MGYRHYLRGRAMHALQRIPSPLRRGLAAAAAPFGGAQWRQRMRSVGYRDWADLYVAITASLRHETTGAVVPDPFGLEDTEYRRTVTALEGCEAETVLRALDLLTTLPDKFLVKVDRAAMHVGLEVRAPFLDRRLVEWALRLPRQWLVRGRTTKALLRELLYRKVPRELVDRPKQGFCPPIGRWLRNELSDWVRDTLAPCRVRDVGPLDERAVTRIVELHASGGIDLGPAVWTLVCFMQWHHRLKSAGTEAVARV
jgi:asparagine synthetase B (glutamine-hydrolysing)